jgi:hypothetical protein
MIYVDELGHLTSPDLTALARFVKTLREAGVIGIRADGVRSIGTPHYDLLVNNDALQTQRNIDLAIKHGAILVGRMQLMRLMRKSGVWTKRSPKSESIS